MQKLTRADSKFEIKTPTSTATVRGTGFLTEVLPSGETTVRTTDGAVAVSAQGQTVLVTEGQKTTVRLGQAPTPPAAVPKPTTTLRFGMHSPAQLVIVDPLGRSCGIASPGAAVVRHIPLFVASSPGSEPQLIDLPDAIAGTYRIVIMSIEPGGPFTLTATGINERSSVSFDLALPGGGQPGAMFGSALEVRSGPDGRLSASALASLVMLQGPQSSASPSPTPKATATTAVVPSLALPTLSIATATPTVAPTPTIAASRPALRTPAPEPSVIATPTPHPTSSLIATPTATAAQPTTRPALRTPASEPISTATPTRAPTPTATPTFTPTPAPSVAPTSSPSPTAAPTAPPATTTPVPGCTPSSNQPKKCVPG